MKSLYALGYDKNHFNNIETVLLEFILNIEFNINNTKEDIIKAVSEDNFTKAKALSEGLDVAKGIVKTTGVRKNLFALCSDDFIKLVMNQTNVACYSYGEEKHKYIPKDFFTKGIHWYKVKSTDFSPIKIKYLQSMRVDIVM